MPILSVCSLHRRIPSCISASSLLESQWRWSPASTMPLGNLCTSEITSLSSSPSSPRIALPLDAPRSKARYLADTYQKAACSVFNEERHSKVQSSFSSQILSRILRACPWGRVRKNLSTCLHIRFLSVVFFQSSQSSRI